MSTQTPILELREVQVSFEGKGEVLRDVSFDVAPGEVAAFVSLDTSGGLTTLLKTAAGLLAPSKGQVLFEGRDVYSMGYAADQAMRAKLGVVLEGGALHPNRSVWENVALPLRYHGGARGELKARVSRLLSDSGFNEDPQSLPWQVSGRGRKLAALARALARDPKLVIVDRFFEGLEMPDWRRLFELVMELNQHQGVSWLLISELDPAIFQVAERVGVLCEGRMIGFDYRRNLLRHPLIAGAFEEAQAAPIRTRSGRYSHEISSHEGLSSAPPEAPLEAGLDVTINIDGSLPLPRPRVIPDLGQNTIVVADTEELAAEAERRRLDREARARARPVLDPSLGATQWEPEPAPLKELEDTDAGSASPPSSVAGPAPLPASSEERRPSDAIDPAVAARARKKAAKRTVQAEAPSLKDPAAARKKAAKRTVQAEAPSLEDPAAARKKAAKRTVQAEAPSLEDPAAARKKAAKRTAQAPAPQPAQPAQPAQPKPTGPTLRPTQPLPGPLRMDPVLPRHITDSQHAEDSTLASDSAQVERGDGGDSEPARPGGA